ncbi:hypothetical protein BCR44DRAFT_330332 [Catenaria anguillulae PL171]|uniref:Uncharacterized protein n=1 Tax=Catenaria anguillulae PL171 TaxID=765915 RepID=A0A1Y2HL65_9FUNG|nr:hypothetical protein BCR44DRAFT_330332 [Catenaria anguillulae PL171]
MAASDEDGSRLFLSSTSVCKTDVGKGLWHRVLAVPRRRDSDVPDHGRICRVLPERFEKPTDRHRASTGKTHGERCKTRRAGSNAPNTFCSTHTACHVSTTGPVAGWSVAAPCGSMAAAKQSPCLAAQKCHLLHLAVPAGLSPPNASWSSSLLLPPATGHSASAMAGWLPTGGFAENPAQTQLD